MGIPIFLSSDDGAANSQSHDFTTVFNPEIILDRNTDHYIGLNKIEMSYSWLNVTKAYNNTKFKYSHNNGTTFSTIEFRDGNYTYNDLQNYINLVIKKNGHNSSEGLDVKFIFYTTILHIQIILSNNFQLDFTEGNFYKLIGAKNSEIISKSEICSTIPNITNSIDSIVVNSNLISESLVFGKHSGALELISVSGLSLSYSFSFEPKRVLFNKINTNIINKIRIYITDTQGRPINLNNVPVSLSLILK